MCLISVYVPHYTIPFFFFNDTATTEIYTLSLHDALPISIPGLLRHGLVDDAADHPIDQRVQLGGRRRDVFHRSEEHTSELQSHLNLVCRLLLEKKKKTKTRNSKNTFHTYTRHPASSGMTH